MQQRAIRGQIPAKSSNMVWTLSGRFADDAEGAPPREFWLRIGEYTVGRKDTDIVLTGDKSISRDHARIQVSQTAESLEGWGCTAAYGYDVIVQQQCAHIARKEALENGGDPRVSGWLALAANILHERLPFRRPQGRVLCQARGSLGLQHRLERRPAAGLVCVAVRSD